MYFGTPAGGAGIHGCIEIGCSVLALCYDDHHRTHLGPFLVQRAVEAMITNESLIFTNQALVACAKQLQLTDTKEDKKDDQNQDKKDGKKEGRERRSEGGEEG